MPSERRSGIRCVTEPLPLAALFSITRTLLPPLVLQDEIQAGMEDVGPFQNVLILELKQMNQLLIEIRRSLATLNMGFSGKLTMSEPMEKLETELSLDKVRHRDLYAVPLCSL
jgi:hypothetical protein